MCSCEDCGATLSAHMLCLSAQRVSGVWSTGGHTNTRKCSGKAALRARTQLRCQLPTHPSARRKSGCTQPALASKTPSTVESRATSLRVCLYSFQVSNPTSRRGAPFFFIVARELVHVDRLRLLIGTSSLSVPAFTNSGGASVGSHKPSGSCANKPNQTRLRASSHLCPRLAMRKLNGASGAE